MVRRSLFDKIAGRMLSDSSIEPVHSQPVSPSGAKPSEATALVAAVPSGWRKTIKTSTGNEVVFIDTEAGSYQTMDPGLEYETWVRDYNIIYFGDFYEVDAETFLDWLAIIWPPSKAKDMANVIKDNYKIRKGFLSEVQEGQSIFSTLMRPVKALPVEEFVYENENKEKKPH